MVPPHTEINDIVSAEDWVPTLAAAAGAPDIKEKHLQGYRAGGTSFKVHLDGYDQRDLFAGKGPDKRREFFYWTDDGNLAGLRCDLAAFGSFVLATAAALVVGKVVLVTNAMPFLRRYDRGPLIQPILSKTVVYWAVVFVACLLEHFARPPGPACRRAPARRIPRSG